MKLFSRTTACICAVIMAASAVSVIGASAAQLSTTAPSAVQSEDSKVKKEVTDENVKFGKVTAINGSEITVSLGELAARSDGEKKVKPSGDVLTEKKQKTSASTDSKSSADSGSTDSTQAKKGGRKHRPDGGFTENGTTLTVTFTDSVTVTKRGQEAAVTDIKEGDIIRLVYDDNGELTGIKLGRGHKHGRKSDSSSDQKTKPQKKTTDDSTAS